jgi:hypothetical protein
MMGRMMAGILAASLVATGFSVPAEAQRRHWRHHDDVDAGDVVAGVAIVGGIAAIASAIKNSNRERQDAAVDDCANEAESRANGRVSAIVSVHKSKGYYTVEGVVDGSPEAGGGLSFLCTVRNHRIYAFDTGNGDGGSPEG